MMIVFPNLLVYLIFTLLLMLPTLLSQREFLHHLLRQALIHSSCNNFFQCLHYRMSYHLTLIPLYLLLKVFFQIIQLIHVLQVMQVIY